VITRGLDADGFYVVRSIISSQLGLGCVLHDGT